MFKIKSGLPPDYLNNILYSLVAERTSYHFRNARNVSTVRRRTELFAKSFLPSTVKFWISLPTTLQNINSLESFNKALKDSFFITPNVPSYYTKGNWRLPILHARLRNNSSYLNNDLYMNHLNASPACACGENIVNAEHYFFNCNRFDEHRLVLFRSTRSFHPLNTNKLFYGVEGKSDCWKYELIFSHTPLY